MSEIHGYLKQVLAHDEEVLLTVRQHWLVLLKHILGSLILTLVTVVLIGGVYVVLMQRRPEAAPFFIFAFLLVLLPLFQLFWKLLVWRNHMYVITSRRVIQMSGVLNKEVVDSLLEKVNDVKTEQPFMGRIFGYGDIEILTANETGINDFHHIARPLEFKRAMLDAKERLDHVAHG